MRRRGLLLVVILGIVLLLTNITQAFQNEPEGFRGLKWGDPPPGENMENWTRIGGNDLLRYERKDDKLKIGEAKLKNIHYRFYKGQFMGVRIQTQAFSYKSLKEVVKLKFGSGYFYDRDDYSLGDIFSSELYQWSGDIATVILEIKLEWDGLRINTGYAYLDIYSTKIYNQYQKDERRKEEEEARRKEEERQKAAEEGLDDF